jgi:hypothetical protein
VHVTLRACSADPLFTGATRVPSGPRRARDGVTQQVSHDPLQRPGEPRPHVGRADETPALESGLRGLTIRLARAVNRALGRRGAVWAERYHARALTTPRAVRHAIVYVLMNHRKDHHQAPAPDPCSSAAWFDGWREPIAVMPGPSPIVQPRTWLAAVGWRRHGFIGMEERPREKSMRGPRNLNPHVPCASRP